MPAAVDAGNGYRNGMDMPANGGAPAARQLMQQCIADSRTLTTQAGSKVALSESEATQYCNCARQQSGTLVGGISTVVGNRCLNQL